MSKYIDAEKLIAKIDNLESFSCISEEQDGFYSAISRINDIIDSLQQEQPEVDLEKEIDLCWQDWISPSNQSSVEGVLPKSEFSMYARHFYELGLNARKEK